MTRRVRGEVGRIEEQGEVIRRTVVSTVTVCVLSVYFISERGRDRGTVLNCPAVPDIQRHNQVHFWV